MYAVKELSKTASFAGAPIGDNSILIPSDLIKEAMMNPNHKIKVPEHDIVSKEEVDQLRRYMKINNENVIREFSKNYSLSIVDLHSLFKKILAKEYTTQDGLFIDPAFPDGNFFSSDGLYPSAIGNAVIANEVINEINKKYGTTIPVINVSAFATSMK